MATYEELSKFLDDYDPQQPAVQQPQGGGLLANAPQPQQLSPYEQMVRERYGVPGQMPAQNAEQPGYVDAFLNGAKANALGVLGGEAEAVASWTGNETAGKIADSIADYSRQFARPKEYSASDKLTLDYWTNPNGAFYDAGTGFGASGVMMAQAAALIAALKMAGVGSVATIPVTALASIAGRLGFTKLASGLLTPAGQKVAASILLSKGVESVSETGGTGGTMTHDPETGLRLKDEEIDREKVRNAMAKNFATQLAIQGVSGVMETTGVGRLLGAPAKGLSGVAKKGAEFLINNGLQNWYEEGAQTGGDLYGRDQIPLSQVFNPFEWNEEQLNDASTGATAGIGQAGLQGGASLALSRLAGKRQQQQLEAGGGGEPPTEQQPVRQYVEPKIVNPVTTTQFAGAVNVALNDQSGNVVDRMRHLQGHITYDANDGTNCARTIGLALVGTDYQDLIKVSDTDPSHEDNFVAVAQKNGQLKDPATYVPKPGDLAVVNGGNHIVMVTESGGTISNGRAGNGVYESNLSPQQMFGAVDHYISTSELSSGGRMNAQANMEDNSAEQLAADETKRRLDAIDEVLTGKPAQDTAQQETVANQAQQQQETVEETPEQYINRNMAQIRPINRYQDAFTPDELSLLNKKERKALKNKLYNFMKKNPSRTLAETYDVMRKKYDELLGKKPNATPATNTQTQATPATPANAGTTAPQNPVVQQQKPVVQQQQAQAQQKANVPPVEEATVTDSTGAPAQQTGKPAVNAQAELQKGLAKLDDNKKMDENTARLVGVKENSNAKAERNVKYGKAKRRLTKLITKNGMTAEEALKNLYDENGNVRTDATEAELKEVERAKQLEADTTAALKAKLATKDPDVMEKWRTLAVKVNHGGINHMSDLITLDGKTAEEAFKETFGFDAEKPEAKPLKSFTFQASPPRVVTEENGGNKNVSTEQKSAVVQESPAEESGDQNVNAQPEKGEQQESQSGESAENKDQTEVKQAEKSRLVKLANRPAKRVVRKFRKEIGGLKATRYSDEKLRKDAEEYKKKLRSAVNTNQATQEEAQQAAETIDKVVENKTKNATLTREERIAKAATGKTVTVRTEDGTKFRVQYKVVEADDIVASNVADGSFAKNPEYPQRLQPRNRESAVSQTTANKIAANLDPELLTENNNANMGAPIIDENGYVENGNLRMLGIMLAHAKENEPARHYEQYLAENAENFGLKRSDVEALVHPVLVRERIDNADGLVEKIINSTTGGQHLNASEQAKQDAKALSETTLSKYRENEKGELNREFVEAAINDIAKMSPNIENEMRTTDGNVSQIGLMRIKNALFARAYGDSKLLERAAEATTDNSKSVTNALLNVAPSVAKIKSAMESGKLFSADFAKPMLEAANKTISMRNEGKGLQEVLQAIDMFGDETDISDGAKQMLQEMGESKGSTIGITRVFNDYLRSVKEQNNNEENIVGAEEVKTADTDKLVDHWIMSRRGGDLFGQSLEQAEQKAAEIVESIDENDISENAILADGRKIIDPKAKAWIDAHPFEYDSTKTQEENANAARKAKADFVEATGIEDSRVDQSEQRKRLQLKIKRHLYNVGIENRKQERKANIIIGLPASGKSTVSDTLLKDGGYLLVDADEAKKLLPEFADGLLAGIVHEESGDITAGLFADAIANGDNICYPTVGGGLESLKRKIKMLHDANYEVTLTYVDIPHQEAVKRVMKRFEDTGRFVEPNIILGNVLENPEGNVIINIAEGVRKGQKVTVPVDNKIVKNYLQIKGERGIEHYEWIDNNLPLKDESHPGGYSVDEKRIERGDFRTEFSRGHFAENTGSDGQSAETPSTETTEQDQVDRADTENQGGSSISEQREKNSFFEKDDRSDNDLLLAFANKHGVKEKAKKPASTTPKKTAPKPSSKLSKVGATAWKNIALNIASFTTAEEFSKNWDWIKRNLDTVVRAGAKDAEIITLLNNIRDIAKRNNVEDMTTVNKLIDDTLNGYSIKNAFQGNNGTLPGIINKNALKSPETLDVVSQIFGDKKAASKQEAQVSNDTIAGLDVSESHEADLEKRLGKILNRFNANPIFDPELWSVGCELGAIKIAKGARTLSQWTKSMVDAIGDAIKPWLAALWQTIHNFKGKKLDADTMSDAFELVGKLKERYPNITADEVYNNLVQAVGDEAEVRKFKPYIKAAFDGITELVTPGAVTAEVSKALGEKKGADNGRLNERVPQNNEQSGTGEKLSQNPASQNAGRTDTAPVRTGSETTETVDNGRNQGSAEERQAPSERTGEDNRRLGGDATEDVRTPAETGQTGGDSGSTVSPDVTEDGRSGESVGSRRDNELRRVPERESANREDDASVPGTRNERSGNAERGERIVSEDGSYEILPSGDYHVIDPEKAEFGTSDKEAFKRNALALSIIKRMREGDDSIEFTPEVKNALANFNGFGRFRNELFNGTYDHMLPKPGWEKEAEQLKELMTRAEWEAAQDSTTTAFYTPYGVTTAMWNLAQQLGLKHGNILEPSMGVGGFFATMPTEILENSTVTGIDLDQNATKIGEALYPSAKIFNERYEDHIVKNNSFDFIVTNVPYDTTSMGETPEAKQFSNPNSLLIHDFFFLRGLNQLRPGGIMMALTSTGTLDKQDTQMRLAMAQQAELVGAIRLPNGMFSKSAGTDVACDLLVFRKRGEPISRLKAAEEPWVQTHTVDSNGKKVFVNNYFNEHKENIVGEMSVASGQFGPVIKTAFKGTAEEMNAALNKVIKENFPKDIMGKTLTKAESDYNAADTSHANHTFYIKDGELMYRKDNAEVNVAKEQPVESKVKRPDKLTKIFTTRDSYDDFIGSHPEFKALDRHNSEFDGKKKPGVVNKNGKPISFTWKETADHVASKNPALAQRAIDVAYNERVALDKQQKTEKLVAQVKPLIELNEKVDALVEAMTKGEDSKTVEKLRKEALDMFNKAVEASPNKKLAWEVTPVKEDGTLGKTRIEYDEALKVIQNFGDSAAFNRLCALDKGDGKPADLLTGVELQSVAQVKEPSIENSLQSQIVDGAQTIDVEKIAEENNKTPDEVLKQLIKDNAVFETLNGDIVPHNVYLSGNVRQKLREAQAMARMDKKFQRNVDALKKVIPEDLTSTEINMTVGASWVPVNMYKAFFNSLVGAGADSNAVDVRNDNGKWVITVDEHIDNSDRWRLELVGDTRKSLSDVFNAAMNKRHLKVFDYDGRTHKSTFNQSATDAVEAKIVEVNDKFQSWLWDENDERREAMEHMYNETMNCTVNPKYNAEFVKTYPGMVKTVTKGKGEKATKRPFFPFKHQCNAVLKFLTEMRGIAAHDAGTGKTLIMSMLCMEMRRTGKAKKPIIFAHNANSAEIARNFNKYYPGAKVLYVKEFSKSANAETTEILLSQMMTGDWDAIVLPHSLMGRVAFKEETALKLRQEEIDYWTQRAIQEANENRVILLKDDLEAVDSHKYNDSGENVMDKEEKKRLGSVANYVRKIRTIKNQCHLMGQRLNQKGYIDFEKTGIDCCLIDEAHEFKKGPKDSSRTVKGLDTSSSNIGTQMDMLAKFINDRNGNKGVFEFTGTLITNTIPEVHQHMKYVMPDVLKQAGIYHLDDFLSSFTETSSDLEPNAAGEPEEVERLRKFTNIPELRNLAGQHIDIVTVKDLPDFSPRLTKSGKNIDDKTLTDEERDYLKNGYDDSARPKGLPNHEVVNVTIPATKRTDFIYKQIKKIAKDIADAKGVVKKELFAKGVGLKFQNLVPGIGASIRNLHLAIKDLNTSKANMCVANIKKEYDDAAAKGLPCAQVIFMEKGYNDERSISNAVGETVAGNKWKKNYTDIFNVAGYNMAKDLQDKLIAAGFSPDEVAIAGGDESKYKDPEERKRLAERIKNGEVKVVIAQYGTMGVGVNMQDNLRAIHHIDAPWMPGELEQENKRGVRQGNHWNTVREYRYISPGMDSKKWAALATKASFIAAFMDTSSKVRTIESDALSEENSGNVNDILSSMSESVGDTRYAQKEDAKKKIERLQKQRTSFETRRRQARDDVKRYREKFIPDLKNKVDHADIDSAVYAHDRDVHPGFSIQIRNIATGEFQTFTDQEKAQSFLDANKMAAVTSDYSDDFIRYRGFKIGVEKVGGSKDGLFSSYYELTARSFKPDFEAEAKEAEAKAKEEAEKAAKSGKKKESAKPKEITDLSKFNDDEYGKGEYKTDTATIGSLKSILGNIGNSKSRWEKALSEAEEKLIGHESQANAEWKDQPKLDALKKKLKAIEDDLKENKVPAPEWFRTVAAIGNLIRYKGSLYPIVGYSIPDKENIWDYGIIVENPMVGNEERIRVPAKDARDENGVPLFQPEDLTRDPRQRIVDEADDVNYTPDFEDSVIEALNEILYDFDPDHWDITSKGVWRKTTEAETGKKGVRWAEKQIGDEKYYESPTTADHEPLGGEYSSFIKRVNKLEASIAESTEPQIVQAVDDLVDDVKTAFPGAKNFRRDGQHITFTMPNGVDITVDIANQLFLSGEEAEQAREAHGKNADEPIRVNGYTETFDRSAAIKLAQDGDRGTAFHESYHPAYNLVLNSKEKAAMEKEYGADAKKQGRSVIEVSADAYRDWQLARKQRKGTRLGKLFQKIQDFAYKALAVFTGTENVHNVMRKIAENEVWNRKVNGSENRTDYLVTNPHLKSDTKIPVLDFSELTELNVDDPNDRLKLQQQLIERFKNGKFKILNGPGIEATVQRINNPDLDGTIRNDKGEIQYFTDRATGQTRPKLKPYWKVNGLLHWVYGARKTPGNLFLRTVPERMKATSSDSAIEKLLSGAVYVEVHPDVVHGGTREDFVEMYAAVKADANDRNPNAVYRYKILAKKMDNAKRMYEIKTIGLYDFFRQIDANRSNDVRKLVDKDGTITAANLLKGIYDRNGRNYVDKKGNLVYDPNVPKPKKEKPKEETAKAEAKPKVEASISSAVDTGLKKAETWANRNQRTANNSTAEGRTAQIFKNATNKDTVQSAVSWLEEQKNRFYRDFVDKNDAFHKVDAQIEAVTGKKLKENSKLYNKVQVLKALISGAATTLIEGNEHSMSALRERIGSTVDANKNPKKAKRAEQLKAKFNLVTMKDVMQTIEYKKMDKAHPDYLEKHGLNNWREAFGNYLGARRLLELMHLAEANNTPYTLPKNISADDLQATVKNAPKEFEEAAQKYYKLQENLLILMEDGGLINQEIHDFMNKTYHDYCPLMVDFSDTASFDKVLSRFVGDGNGIVNVSSMLKFVLEEGSERGLLSPLESTYKSISMLTSRAERNKVASYFVQAVENDEDLKKSGLLTRVPGKSDDPKNCVFTVLMNGEKVAYKTTQDLYGPIVGGDEPTGGLAFSLMKNTARTLRAGATSSPSFIVRNLIRDTIFAGVSSRNGFVPVIDSFKGMWALWNDPKLKGEFEATGVTAFNYYRSAEQAVASLDQLAGGKFEIHSLGDFVKAFFKYAGVASDFVEAGTRMGEFMRARAAGKSLEEAALDAKDVTLDFSRSGEVGQKYNQIIPFFNACIQGGDKMIRLLADPKTRMHTARMLGMYIMLPSLLLWMWNKDEPWYEELDPNVKMGSWILPGGLRIPKPQEAGIIFGSGIEAFMDKMTERDPKAMANWRKAAREAFLPNLIPTLFLPLMEWQANYSFFREKALEGKRLQKLPVEQRYNNSTSELNKLIGSKTGMSPVKLDNTVRGFLGTMGMFAWQLPDAFFESKNNLPSKKFKERTFVRDFVLNDLNQNRTQEDFYDLVSAAQQQHAGYGKKGKPSLATTAINKALRDVSARNKEIQQITNAKGLSPERKRQLIDQKRKVIHQIQKATLKKYRSRYDI